MGNLNKVVYLTNAQAQTLFANGTITVDGVTVTYSPDDLYVTPSGEVTDVQVNGTSVVSSGVANMPFGQHMVLGVVKAPDFSHRSTVGAGVYVSADGTLGLNVANDAAVKAGATATAAITPSTQDKAVFYGLAKVAGENMSGSSNTAGEYTDEALKAIRKMLGIPNTKWEFINEVTTTEDATEIVVNTDLYEMPFKLRKLIAIFSASASTTGAKDSFYVSTGFINMNDTSTYSSAPSLQYPSATSTMLARVEIEAEPGMPLSTSAVIGTSDGNTQNYQKMPKSDLMIAKYITYLRIYQSGSTKSLIPSGSTLKVYGIRYDD